MRVRVGKSYGTSSEDSSEMELQNMSGQQDTDQEQNRHANSGRYDELPTGNNDNHEVYKDMSNGKVSGILSFIVWFFISILNFWLLASLAVGKNVPL
ncbi:hypothetical protein HII12_005198 [Brettanomyces bruxellensis]|uniref:Uncharacterized protein n=1 Tax=Dekkera bruxellensis TaxID=5007 RepID=A0A8H6B6I6_DEKBR|nr:hypothetical protein HII12_005198 [Brettanomyces bruxellensis]